MERRKSWVLAWIVAFKALKAVLLAAVGVAIFANRRADPADLLTSLALAVHLPLSSALFARVMAFAGRLTVRKEEALALTSCAYAALMATEGVGLYFRAPWARWLTVVATSTFIPVEIYEIFRAPHLTRFVVLLANVAIVGYLLRRPEAFEALDE